MVSKACLFQLTTEKLGHLAAGAGVGDTSGSVMLYVGVSVVAWMVTHL